MMQLRTVYHGTTPLLEDAIRGNGMPEMKLHVAGDLFHAEFYAARAAAFGLINGITDDPRGLIVTLEVEADRLRLDTPRVREGHLAPRLGHPYNFDGPLSRDRITSIERVTLDPLRMEIAERYAKTWGGWPGALPEGQQPVGPDPDEPPMRRLSDGWDRQRRRRGRRRGNRESWGERCARIEQEDRDRAAALAVQKDREEAWARELERTRGTAPQEIPDARRLLVAVHASPSSSLHAAGHALEVAFAGVRLIEAGAPADPAVVLAFAVLHDSQRRSEGHDPEHGARAAEVARDLYQEVHGLSAAQLEVLCSALVDHARGRTSTDPTIGACWDADRLTLRRVGIAPRPEYMSTTAGRELAADPPEPPADASWEWIGERLGELTQGAYARTER
jgi:uncharacterized protein